MMTRSTRYGSPDTAAASHGRLALIVFLVLLTVPSRADTQEVTPERRDTLTLADALESALAGSPAMMTAQAERTTGRAGRWASWGALIPSLSLSTGLNQSAVLQRTVTDPITGGIISLPDSLIQIRETYGTSAVVSADWTVFDGGRRIWGIRQAESEARAADLALDAARARVAASVTLAYLDALEAVALEDTRRAELERAAELHRLAEARFAAGAVPQLDVLQARLVEGDAELALLEAESAAEAARLALIEYVPSSDGRPIALTDPADPQLPELPDEEWVLTCMIEASPELASLRASRDAARRQSESERLWLLPRVTFGATWIRSEFGLSRDAITLDARNEQTYYRVGLSWTPLAQPGQQFAATRRASAAVEMAQARLASTRAGMVREVAMALQQIRRAREMEDRRALNLQIAQLQREHAEERYRLGAGSLAERLQAEALAQEAERQAIIARYALLRGQAQLQMASGMKAGATCSALH